MSCMQNTGAVASNDSIAGAHMASPGVNIPASA